MTASGTVLAIASDMDVSAAVLFVGEEAVRAGLDAADRSRAMTAASELATNVRKYAGRGTLTVRRLEDGARRGLEIVVEDRGPGIPDVELAMRDRYSTSGTLGLGLPGARRMMDEFEIQSAPGKGTRVCVRKWRA